MQPLTVPRSLKEKQRQEREALILQAAEAVLLEKGYYEMSMDEIAARVGIAKGTVYLHFASKEELVLALVERDMQQLMDIVENNVCLATTSREKLEIIFQAIYRGYFEKGVCIPYLINNSGELRRLYEEKKGRVREKWEQIFSLIRALIEEGKTNGEFDPEIPTQIMLSAFFSQLSPRSYERLLNEEHMTPEEIARHLKRLYFKSIAVVKGNNL